MRAKHLQPLPKNPTRFRARPIIEPPTANAPKLHLQRSLRGGPSSPSLVGPAAGWEAGRRKIPQNSMATSTTRDTPNKRAYPYQLQIGSSLSSWHSTTRDLADTSRLVLPQAAQGVRGSGRRTRNPCWGLLRAHIGHHPRTGHPGLHHRQTASGPAETSRGRGSWITASHRATRGRRMNYP